MTRKVTLVLSELTQSAAASCLLVLIGLVRRSRPDNVYSTNGCLRTVVLIPLEEQEYYTQIAF